MQQQMPENKQELPLPTRKNNSQLQNYTGKMPSQSKEKAALRYTKVVYYLQIQTESAI